MNFSVIKCFYLMYISRAGILINFCVILFIHYVGSKEVKISNDPTLYQTLFAKPGYYDKMFGTFSEADRLKMLQLARETFFFAYDNYMEHAFPADELNPIYCKGRSQDSENPYVLQRYSSNI